VPGVFRIGPDALRERGLGGRWDQPHKKRLSVSESPSARYLTRWDPHALADLAQRFTVAERTGTPCMLDFADRAIAGSSSPSAVRLWIPSVMVVANLLVGRFRDVPIALRIPSSKGLRLQLARGGFFFALANRPSVRWVDQAPEEWGRAAEAWVNPFHPSDKRMRREALVDVRDPQSESWVVHAAFQRYLLSVMHPHTRPARFLYRDLRQIAGRWLSGRLRIRPGSEMVQTLSDCLEVFYQIVVNVPDHASLRSSTSGCSLGQVYATLGGGRHSYNRLHFSIIDNGVGLPHRVNKLYPDRTRKAEDALRDALMGRLPRPPGGRGVGLDLVRRITQQYVEGIRGVGGASNIWIVTNGDNPTDASQMAWQADLDAPSTTTIPSLPVKGTLVWVSLGLAHRVLDEDSQQLELEFTRPIPSSSRA